MHQFIHHLPKNKNMVFFPNSWKYSVSFQNFTNKLTMSAHCALISDMQLPTHYLSFTSQLMLQYESEATAMQHVTVS